jgi:hypothetical protein
MNKNRISGRVGGVSGHKTTKPSGSAHTVNAAVAGRKFTSLSGEISSTGRPGYFPGSSPTGNRRVIDEKSAEAIVGEEAAGHQQRLETRRGNPVDGRTPLKGETYRGPQPPGRTSRVDADRRSGTVEAPG